MADLGRSQNYLNRDYQSIRADLMNLLKVHYPDQFQDFNSASIGMSLVELLAYVSDILSYNTDTKFNELFLENSLNFLVKKPNTLLLAQNYDKIKKDIFIWLNFVGLLYA